MVKISCARVKKLCYCSILSFGHVQVGYIQHVVVCSLVTKMIRCDDKITFCVDINCTILTLPENLGRIDEKTAL